jgi:hypothetical protein
MLLNQALCRAAVLLLNEFTLSIALVPPSAIPQVSSMQNVNIIGLLDWIRITMSINVTT